MLWCDQVNAGRRGAETARRIAYANWRAAVARKVELFEAFDQAVFMDPLRVDVPTRCQTMRFERSPDRTDLHGCLAGSDRDPRRFSLQLPGRASGAGDNRTQHV